LDLGFCHRLFDGNEPAVPSVGSAVAQALYQNIGKNTVGSLRRRDPRFLIGSASGHHDAAAIRTEFRDRGPRFGLSGLGDS
jgi:hypothetical protein